MEIEKPDKIIKEIPAGFDNVFPFSPKRFHYQRVDADDEKLALVLKNERRRYRGFLLYIPLIISFLFSIYINWLVLKVAFLLVFAYVLYFCIFGIKVKSFVAIVFNREEGTIQYPVWQGKKIVDYVEPFGSATFLIHKGALYIGYSDDMSRNPLITDNEPYHAWDFLVWYMDNNRPLPPGKVFDPYRQRDYDRWKKAGSSQPLYPSNAQIG